MKREARNARAREARARACFEARVVALQLRASELSIFQSENATLLFILKKRSVFEQNGSVAVRLYMRI